MDQSTKTITGVIAFIVIIFLISGITGNMTGKWWIFGDGDDEGAPAPTPVPLEPEELGYIAPVINLKCDFKHPAACGDRIIIRTTAVKPEIAALTFKFEILLKENRNFLARGETTQVLLTTNRKMIYRLSGEIEKRIGSLVNYCLQE